MHFGVANTWQSEFFGQNRFLLLLIPDISGRPDESDLIAHLGEAEVGKFSGSQNPDCTSETVDAIFYPWVVMGFETMYAIEIANLDPGFASNVRFFAMGMSR